MSDEEKPRRRRRKRLTGDSLRPKPIRRTPDEEEEAEVSRLLAYAWEILSPADRREALACATVQGEAVAEAFGGLPDQVEDGDYLAAYRTSAVRWALEGSKVINDIDYELWRFEDRDPRIDAFARGVRNVLGDDAPRRTRPALKKRSSRTLRELDRLLDRVWRYAERGGNARVWLARVEELGAVPRTTLEELTRRLKEDGLLD